jgi:hypothetical protein
MELSDHIQGRWNTLLREYVSKADDKTIERSGSKMTARGTRE